MRMNRASVKRAIATQMPSAPQWTYWPFPFGLASKAHLSGFTGVERSPSASQGWMDSGHPVTDLVALIPGRI